MSYELVAASGPDDSLKRTREYLLSLKDNPRKDRDDVARWFKKLERAEKEEMMKYVGKPNFGTREKYVASDPMDPEKAKEVLSTWIAKLSFESMWDLSQLAVKNISLLFTSTDEALADAIEKRLRMTEDVKFAILSKDSNVLYDDDFWKNMCGLVGKKKFEKDKSNYLKFTKIPKKVRTERCAHIKEDKNFLTTFNYGGYLREALRNYRLRVGVKRPYDHVKSFTRDLVENIDKLDDYPSVKEWLRTFDFTLPKEWNLPGGVRKSIFEDSDRGSSDNEFVRVRVVR